jgi:potassium channel subfamily K member 18
MKKIAIFLYPTYVISNLKDVMRGLNVMYDFMRRPSLAFDPRYAETIQQQIQQEQIQRQIDLTATESPMTPIPENLENYEIDDEFNLPISVAILMLLTYMGVGAVIYKVMMRGEWSFLEALYFVFISISTIGKSV